MESKPEHDLAVLNPACPKRGEAYLYLIDWGKTGALFVHGYNTDASTGFKYKLACQAPEPAILRWMTINEWRGPVEGIRNRLDFRQPSNHGYVQS